MIYSFSYHDQIPVLPAVPGLEFRECDDGRTMAVLNQIPVRTAQDRLFNDNRAYVAWLNDVAVAFGWVALGKARIGELNHEFIVPMNHAYLWNFRTLPDFKGLGIYPRLLQFILENEPAIERFWILHAPENEASRRGILKAGFKFVGDVSLSDAEHVICKTAEKDQNDFAELFDFTATETGVASCWNCSSPYIRKKSSDCCCLLHEKACTGSLALHRG